MTAFKPVLRVTSIAAPLLRDNIDTDQIIPSREITSTGKTGLADGLFAGWRYLPGTRTPDPAFVLNQPAFAGARILLGGANFGSGSSREHAVWALAEYGIQAIVAAGFAPIFFANCIRNGIVPAVVPQSSIDAAAAQGGPVTVDVVAGTVGLADGRSWTFPLESEARAMLTEGLDGIDLTMKLGAEIAAFHARDRVAHPWIYLERAQ